MAAIPYVALNPVRARTNCDARPSRRGRPGKIVYCPTISFERRVMAIIKGLTMSGNSTIFWTILTGVLTYTGGQLILKMILEPVQDMRKTIGNISHSLIHYANVISNPGIPPEEKVRDTSNHIRSLSSEIQSHLYLVPIYDVTAAIFRLPKKNKILEASKSLLGLSNSLFRETEKVYEHNAKRVEIICDSLDIFLPEDERWPDDA
jgi:hypothetical protein